MRHYYTPAKGNHQLKWKCLATPQPTVLWAPGSDQVSEDKHQVLKNKAGHCIRSFAGVGPERAGWYIRQSHLPPAETGGPHGPSRLKETPDY